MELARIHRIRGPLYRLEGVRCTACGALSLPPRELCGECGGADSQIYRFTGRGTLFSYTEVFMAPEDHTAAAPYYIGLVRLEEGILVLAQLTDMPDDELKMGMPLESVFRKIMADGNDGLIVYGYKFRPLLQPEA